jgi:hypothetical protein
MLKIALDYDNTYTADKKLWNKFIDLVQLMDHEVLIVTMRSKESDWNEELGVLDKDLNLNVIFCDGNPKRKFCEDLGIQIDIWIDDYPEGIHLGTQYTTEQLQEWREEEKAKLQDKTLKVA